MTYYFCRELNNIEGYKNDDPIFMDAKPPMSIVIGGYKYFKLIDRELFYQTEDGLDFISVRLVDYVAGHKKLPGPTITFKNKVYNCIGGEAPNIGDMKDVFRRNHDNSYRVKVIKPPLQANERFGYGLS